jgi:hypothetical protein
MRHIYEWIFLVFVFSESNSTAVKYFNSGNLLPVLVKCLEISVFGVDTAIAVGEQTFTSTVIPCSAMQPQEFLQ